MGRRLRPIIPGIPFKGKHRKRRQGKRPLNEKPESKEERTRPAPFSKEFLEEMKAQGIPVDYDRLIKKKKRSEF